MIFNKKYFAKFIVFFLTLTMVFNPWLVPVAWAEGEEATVAGEEATPTPPPAETTTASVEPTATPAPAGDSSTTTGDAQAQASVETTVNVNQDCLPGQVGDPTNPCTPPTVTTQPSNCGNEGINSLGNDNTATLSGEATSSASTGSNQITNSSGDADLDTGDATASGEITNLANSNTVLIDSSDSGDCAQGTDLASTDEATASSLVVDNQNQAQVENQETVTASTGENQVNDNLGSATIVTGKAMALANLLNYLNSNIVGSDFEIWLLNQYQGSGTLNLNEIWKEIIGSAGEGWQLVEKDGQFLLVKNLNQADLVNNVLVTADTGNNQANDNGNGATIQTSDATALANVINLVNLNLLGSKFFLGIINIFGDFSGDLILPRPEMFLVNSSGEAVPQSDSQPIVFNNNNQAQVADSVATQANTGSNQAVNTQGDNLMQTGAALSQANSTVIANTNILYNNWFFLIVNHLGSWLGNIFGWSSPGEIQAPGEEISQTFQINSQEQNNPSSETAENLDSGEATPSVMLNDNQVTVENNLLVTANTGSNQANNNRGGTSIRTGKATALANLLDLINLNIWGSRWFMGIVNVLGNWTGNIVFAYPDIAVGLNNGGGTAIAGGMTHFTVEYRNQGYDEANNVWMRLDLPGGIEYLSDNSGFPVSLNGQSCSWLVGDIKMGQAGSFQIEVQVDPDRPTASQPSFFSRLLAKIASPVQAVGEESWELVAVATATSETPESNLSNNSASAKTVVYQENEADQTEPGVDDRQPKLEITAWNNVNDFVYPGDTVTFQITIKNTSDVPAYNTYVVQELADGVPYKDFGAAGFDIGTIEPYKQVVLSFGLRLANDGVLLAGFYHTTAIAYANASNGDEVVSNQAKTSFQIEWRQISSVLEAKAVGKEEEVLGAACQPEKENILPYLLALLVSSLWLVDKSRKGFIFKSGGSEPDQDKMNVKKDS